MKLNDIATVLGIIISIITISTFLAGLWSLPQKQPPQYQPTPQQSTPTPRSLPSFEEQASYAGDCGSRPTGSVCIGYEDGYVWLVYDSILGGEEDGTWQGKKIYVAKDFKADYYHVLGTLLVKQMPK